MWEWDKYFLHDFSLYITANTVLLQDISWTWSCTINSLNLKRPSKEILPIFGPWCKTQMDSDLIQLRALGLLGEDLNLAPMYWFWAWQGLGSLSVSIQLWCTATATALTALWGTRIPQYLKRPRFVYCLFWRKKLLCELTRLQGDCWCWLFRVTRTLEDQAGGRRAVALKQGSFNPGLLQVNRKDRGSPSTPRPVSGVSALNWKDFNTISF